MLVSIIQVHRNLFFRMLGIIDFDPINRKFASKFIQQFLIKTHKTIVPPRMGKQTNRPAAMSSIQAPVYGFYAGDDARITATVPGTQLAMKNAGKRYEADTYANAGHGFMRAGEAPDASEGNKAARAAAWERVKRLMKVVD